MILPVIRAGLLAVAVLLSGQAAADTDADVSFFEGDVVEKLTRDTFIRYSERSAQRIVL